MTWSELDLDPADIFKKLDSPEKIRFCQLCHDVFEANPLGKELITTLARMIDFPVAPYQQPGSYAYFREGQNNIIRTLIYAATKNSKS